jgi:hypothetical protein
MKRSRASLVKTTPTIPSVVVGRAAHESTWMIATKLAGRLAAAAAILLVLNLPGGAAEPERLDSPTALSGASRYAREVTAECMRNKAHGLSTKGMPLALFCEREGTMAAFQAGQRAGLPNAAPRGTAPGPRP